MLQMTNRFVFTFDYQRCILYRHKIDIPGHISIGFFFRFNILMCLSCSNIPVYNFTIYKRHFIKT